MKIRVKTNVVTLIVNDICVTTEDRATKHRMIDTMSMADGGAELAVIYRGLEIRTAITKTCVLARSAAI